MSYSACVNVPDIPSLAPTTYVKGTITTTSVLSKSSNGKGMFGDTSIVVGIGVGLVILVVFVVGLILYKCRKRASQDSRYTAYFVKDGGNALSDFEGKENMPLTISTESNENYPESREKKKHYGYPYYKTKTFEHIENLVKNSSVGILIVGEPGSGKSVLAEMLYERFRWVNEEGGKSYQARLLESLQMTENYPRYKNSKMIFIIDDCFEDWIQYPHLVSTSLEQLQSVHKSVVEDEGNSLVLTISKNNFESNLDVVQKLKFKDMNIIDMSSKKFNLDTTDRIGILEYHRKKKGLPTARMEEKNERIVTNPDIEPFYKTRTYEYVEKQVEESAVSIVIIGNPGIGKSVLVEMFHNNFHGKKVNGSFYDSQQLKRLEDVDSYPSHDGAKMIYIIDDCFEDWNQYPHLVTTALEKFNNVHEEIVKGKGNSVIVTISKWNFDKNLNAIQKARLKQCDKLQLVDLSEKEFELDITDKSGILEFHRKKRESTTQRLDNDDLRKVIAPGIIQSILSYVSEPYLEFEFPLSCRLFYSHESFVAQKEDFFNETKKKIGEYVRALSKGSSEEKSQYCTLIYMALSGGKVQDQKKPNLPFLEAIASARSIELDEKTFNFGCCLVKKGNDDVYEIVHEEITTLLFASFGFVNAAFVIDSCDIEVLLKFMRTEDRKLRDEYYNLGLLVLTYNMYSRFAKKLLNLNEAKRMHIIFKDEHFERKFRTILKKKKSENVRYR